MKKIGEYEVVQIVDQKYIKKEFNLVVNTFERIERNYEKKIITYQKVYILFVKREYEVKYDPRDGYHYAYMLGYIFTPVNGGKTTFMEIMILRRQLS